MQNIFSYFISLCKAFLLDYVCKTLIIISSSFFEKGNSCLCLFIYWNSANACIKENIIKRYTLMQCDKLYSDGNFKLFYLVGVEASAYFRNQNTLTLKQHPGITIW